MKPLITLLGLVALCLLWYGAVPRRAAPSSGVRDGRGPGPSRAPARLTLGTYNIHGGKGTDGNRDIARTARVIDGAHVVALQEVRAGWRRDQAAALGDALGLEALFVPSQRRWFRDYRGNGLLSALPIRRWRSFCLPQPEGRRYRVYTIAEIGVGERVLSVLFTHLHTRAGREQQLRRVLEHFAHLPPPCVMLADLNSARDDAALRAALPVDAVDGVAAVPGVEDGPRVDWILTRGVEISGGGRTDAGASDHPYYWVEVELG